MIRTPPGCFCTRTKPANPPRLALLQVREHYCHVPVYVMANGAQENPAHFKDSLRVYYLYNYINEALKGEAHLVWIVCVAICMISV